jgi:uncharacterized protein (DUF697 family)/GTP-binding protein EngB required for normal cell division
MMDMEYERTFMQEPRGWLDRMDWAGVRQEVEMEARAEIVLLGMGNAGKSTLFNSLRGWPVTLAALKLGRAEQMVEERMGLFTLVDLPDDANPDAVASLAGWGVEQLERATMLVYVLDGAVGCRQEEADGAVVRPVDCRWIGLLRATGRPLLVVLNKADLWDDRAGRPDRLEDVLSAVERRLGAEVLPVSAYDSPEVQCRFLERMVEICPDLGVPLGREIAAFRRVVAQRLTRRAALLCGLVAMEPIPLIDLPMQVGAQVGLVARIGAVYGRPPASDYSKELVLTGAGSVALRLLAQQVVKIVPLLGWAVSGLLGAATTWLVGQTALAYFEGHATPRGVGHLLSDLWQEQVRPGCRRAAGLLFRFCPVVWAVRKLKELWKYRSVKCETYRDTQHAIRIVEVRDELVETETTPEEDGNGRGADPLLARGAAARLAGRAPEWDGTRRGPGDGPPVRTGPGEEPGPVAGRTGER